MSVTLQTEFCLDPSPDAFGPKNPGMNYWQIGGACVARMTLCCQKLQAAGAPCPAMARDAIYNHARPHNHPNEPASLWGLDPLAMIWALNDLDTQDSAHGIGRYQYALHTFAGTDPASLAAANSKLVNSIDIYGIPPAAVVQGLRWVGVSGYVTNASNQITAFWVNDPDFFGAGQPLVYALAEWAGPVAPFFSPVSAQSPTWGGSYVVLTDPDVDPTVERLVASAPVEHKRPGDVLIEPSEAVQLALEGLHELGLDARPDYAGALERGRPAEPILVQRAEEPKGEYYIVAITEHGTQQSPPWGAPVLAAMGVHAWLGDLLATFAAETPSPLIALSPDEARHKVAEEGFPVGAPLSLARARLLDEIHAWSRAAPTDVAFTTSRLQATIDREFRMARLAEARVRFPEEAIHVSPTMVFGHWSGVSLFRPAYVATAGYYRAYVNSYTGEIFQEPAPYGEAPR